MEIGGTAAAVDAVAAAMASVVAVVAVAVAESFRPTREMGLLCTWG